MITTQPAEVTATLTELAALRVFFQTASAKLREGHILNMQGIDDRVGSLCKIVQAAPGDQQQIFLPEMTILIELLNAYERDLRALQDLLTKDILQNTTTEAGTC